MPLGGASPGKQASLLVLLLVLCAASSLPGATSLPTGDGGPECGIAANPCPMEPGTHEGSLQPVVNERDHYVLTPPQDPASIHVEATADATIEVVLRDPEGRVRSVGHTVFHPEVNISAVAQPAGEWTLEVGYFFGGGALAGNSYTIDLEWQSYEHVERFEVPDSDAPTVGITFPGNDSAQLDLLYATDGYEHPGAISFAGMYAFQIASEDFAFLSMGGLVSCCGMFDDLARSWGAPPEDIHLETPPVELLGDGTAAFIYRHVGQPATVDIGYSVSTGMQGATAWIAYDGEAPTFEVREDDRAFYHRLSDMEGGDGVVVGGYANAQDLWAEEEIASEETHISMLFASGRAPSNAIQPTQASMTLPSGEQEDLSGQLEFYTPGFEDTMDGTWRYDLHHVDGQEGDTLRFGGASFPITPFWHHPEFQADPNA